MREERRTACSGLAFSQVAEVAQMRTNMSPSGDQDPATQPNSGSCGVCITSASWIT